MVCERGSANVSWNGGELTGSRDDQGDARESHQARARLSGGLSELRLGVDVTTGGKGATYKVR